MSLRIDNFNPGPAALPLPVIEKIKEDLPNFQQTGMSVLEISHRSDKFDELLAETITRLKRLMGLGDDYRVLFIQGGASLQFAMAPLNLCDGGRPAFIDTGTWSTKAIEQAEKLGFEPEVIASSADRGFCYIPDEFEVPSDAAYLHLVSNNTIKGTQWQSFPRSPVPMVVDMSSDILSRAVDHEQFGLIFAGAQKNLGPAGVCVVIIREDMLERKAHPATPIMLNYATYAEKNSLYNTPPSFAIYVVGLMLAWIEDQAGGLVGIEAQNLAKAKLLYDFMDESEGFYRPTAEKEVRSAMNVTFRLASEELESQFLAEALDQGFGGLKGHRSVGGCRASIYNAISLDQVERLVAFMRGFAGRKG